MSRFKEEEEWDDPDEFVLAVFVVRFDTNLGNIVEWTYPESTPLPSKRG